MDSQQRIKELEEKIQRLSNEALAFRQQLRQLTDELNALKNDETNATVIAGEWNDEPAPANQTLENYIGLRFIHFAGIIVLVIGLSIGVKYAIDKELISPALRIILAYGAGIALFLLSMRLKSKYQLFSSILFSGSMASIYFTTYAAFVYYHFFPGSVAFGIMVLLTIYTVFAAINYNRQEIAVLGMVGAYGIPFLVSANAERVDLFFSYILLINVGVAFISFRRTWKLMQYLALIITWILFNGWAFIRFEERQWLTGLAFMSAYFVLFLISALAPALQRKTELSSGQLQQVLINNIALYVAGLLVLANGGLLLSIAGTTGAMTILIALLAIAGTFILPAEKILQRWLAWQSIVLLVIFIGARWSGLTVTLSWILVAVLLFIWGVINQRSWPRLTAMVLMGVTLGKLFLFDTENFTTIQKIIAFLVMGVLLLLFSFYYQRFNLSEKKRDKGR